ncbi:DUF4238 domain-containing protein [Leifsonia sp. YAF41]|uniref:DUF4238 domain-containing protein n=1 Tax=Leifsonia sp. YAF41 TaxID=3233086 RepID=UPI003F98D51C
MIRPGKTNDHTVPQMYLRRFAVGTGTGHRLSVSLVSDLRHSFMQVTENVGASKGFYWGTTPDGIPFHDMEDFLSLIEGDAAEGFREVLDSESGPHSSALPLQWPPSQKTRAALSWWLAVQVLRTTRQRERITAADTAEGRVPPTGISRANSHLQYIVKWAEPIARGIYNRPWGIGFSVACLLTSDVPVLVLNGQDHDNQSLAIDFWDLYLPVGPHRALYLPGRAHRNRNQIHRDHWFQLHAGHGMGLNESMVEVATKHVFFHPDHDPREFVTQRTKHPRPGEAFPAAPPRLILNYEPFEYGLGIERRWLTEHPPRATEPSAPNHPFDVTIVEELAAQLDSETAEFDHMAGHSFDVGDKR